MQESLCRASFTAGSTRFAPQPPFPYINMTNAQSPPGGCPRYRNRSRAPHGRAGRGEGAGFGRSRLRRRPAQRKMMCRGGCARVVRRWWLAATENSSSLALWSWWIESRGQMCNSSSTAGGKVRWYTIGRGYPRKLRCGLRVFDEAWIGEAGAEDLRFLRAQTSFAERSTVLKYMRVKRRGMCIATPGWVAGLRRSQ